MIFVVLLLIKNTDLSPFPFLAPEDNLELLRQWQCPSIDPLLGHHYGVPLYIYQIGWFLGKVPNGGGVIFNRNNYVPHADGHTNGHVNIVLEFCWKKSDSRDLWPLRHVIRVMGRHDLNNKKTMTKTKTYREHLQRAILDSLRYVLQL